MDETLNARIQERLRKLKGEPESDLKTEFTVTPEQYEEIQNLIKPKPASAAQGALLILAVVYLLASSSIIVDWLSFVGSKEYYDWKQGQETKRSN